MKLHKLKNLHPNELLIAKLVFLVLVIIVVLAIGYLYLNQTPLPVKIWAPGPEWGHVPQRVIS